MNDTVTLKHALHVLPIRYEYFYDGQAVARDGLLTLPVDDINHIRAAFFRGYNMTPDGERLVTFQDLDRYIESQTAKSAEVDDEGTVPRGFSTPEDRVRKSKSYSRKKVSG